MSLKKTLLIPTILFITILVILQIKMIGDFQLDDTYISFSFSKNLAAGNGLIYSNGVRVEGYSNFLWVVLIAPLIKIWPHADIYLLARTLMVPFVLLLFYATFELSKSLTSYVFSCLSILLLGFMTDIYSAAIVALETIPYTALLTLGFAYYLKNPKDLKVIPILVLAALMRIDGFIPLLLLSGFEIVRRITNKDINKKELFLWLIPALSIYLLWFAWRWNYYGLLFPTTYYAKSHIATALPNRGYEYAWAAFKSCGGITLFPFIIFLVFRRINYRTLWLTFFVIIHIAYVIHMGGDWMPFERFFIPIFPILVVLFLGAIKEILKVTNGLKFLYRTPYITLCILAYLHIAIWTSRFFVNTTEEQAKIGSIEWQKINVQINMLPAAIFYSPVIQAGEKLVNDFTGVFSVFTQAHVLDMWGLCNKEVALRGTTQGINPIYGLTCPQCLAEENPDYFLTMTLPKNFESFKDHDSVINNIWQGDQIGRYLDLKNDYVTGKITDTQKHLIGYFVERKKVGKNFTIRHPSPHIIIEYPFLAENTGSHAP